MKYNRIFTIVLDSMGIGAMPDCEKFGDKDVDTLGHISKFRGSKGFKIPNLQKLGLANLKPLVQVPAVDKPLGYYCAMNELSNGKDTMTGHWEMMGIKTTKPFITFTDNGFPPELIKELEEQTGHEVIGNKASSGTVILDELAEEEINSNGKKMIVYTSADSVLQICGNEEVFGLDELYRCCEIARKITMKDEWRVGRVIARPYLGRKKGEFKRTANRHDLALKPTDTTTLNMLKDAGYEVISVGKINDIFVGEGVTESNRSKSSVHGMEQTIDIAKRNFKGLCFVNLVDFDALWGHRRNPEGYASEIEKFDIKLAELEKVMHDDDLLILTADHGNDPTAPGTDHTREKVPFLAWSPSMKSSGQLPETDTFGVIGATIADNFGIANAPHAVGYSILNNLK